MFLCFKVKFWFVLFVGWDVGVNYIFEFFWYGVFFGCLLDIGIVVLNVKVDCVC